MARRLRPLVVSALCFNAAGAALPLVFLLSSDGLPKGLDTTTAPLYPGARWVQLIRVVGITLCGWVLCAAFMLPALVSTAKLRKLLRCQRRLIFSDMAHKLLVDSVCHGSDLTYCLMGVPITPHTAVFFVALVAVPTAWSPALLEAVQRAFEAAH